MASLDIDESKGQSESATGQCIKAIQNLFVVFVAIIDILEITHFCCSFFGDKIDNLDGATFYAFSVSVTNTPRLKTMQYPKLVE